MFTKSNKNGNGGKISETDIPASPSLLSSDLKTSGEIYSGGEVQIDGQHAGNVVAKTIILGSTANVVGDLFADSVVINGGLQGEVKGRSVSLGKTACVVGDILHQFIAIEKGAELEGHCRRTEHLEDDREAVKNKKSSTVSLVIRGKKP